LSVGSAAEVPERLEVRSLDVVQLREEVVDTCPPGHWHVVKVTHAWSCSNIRFWLRQGSFFGQASEDAAAAR
jgi:hypothetical protein